MSKMRKSIPGFFVFLVAVFFVCAAVANSASDRPRHPLAGKNAVADHGAGKINTGAWSMNIHPLTDESIAGTQSFAAAPTKFIYSATPVDGDILTETDLYVVNENGSGKVAVANNPDGELFEAYSGGYIIYRLNRDGFQNDLLAVLPDGTGRVDLAVDADEENFIAAKNGWVIYGKNYDPSEKRGDVYSANIKSGAKYFLGENVYYKDIIGERVLFVHDDFINGSWDYNMYSIKFDGTGLTSIAPADGREEYCGQVNDYYVIFAKSEDPTTQNDLYSMPVDASMDRPYILAKTQQVELFSGVHNGRVIYTVEKTNWERDLYTIKPDGTDKKTIVSGTKNYLYVGGIADRYYYLNATNEILYSIKTSITGRANLGHMQTPPRLLGVIGSYLIYDDWYGWYSDYYSVLTTGGTPILLAKAISLGLHENVQLDMISKKVVLNRRFGNGLRDIKTINPNGTGLTSIAVTAKDEYFAFATANRYIFGIDFGDKTVEPKQIQWDVYSILFNRTDRKPIADNPDYNEGFLRNDCPISN